MHYRFGGLIFGGAYTWRGLFSEFYGMVRAGIAEDSRSQRLKNSRTLALIGPVEGVEATLSYFFLQFDNLVL